MDGDDEEDMEKGARNELKGGLVLEVDEEKKKFDSLLWDHKYTIVKFVTKRKSRYEIQSHCLQFELQRPESLLEFNNLISEVVTLI